MKKRQELPNFQKVKLKVDTNKILEVYNENIEKVKSFKKVSLLIN